jgi:hypothetical protein
MKNILIFPTDDRLGQLSAIHHYNMVGCNVYIPKLNTFNLNWGLIACWPSLLSKDPDTGSLNLKSSPDINLVFGEDFFLLNDKLQPNLDTNLSCKLIDEKDLEQIEIDIFHTLRGAESHLKHYFSLKEKYFPNAKWVSSTFNTYDSNPGNRNPSNIAKILPASYENRGGENQFKFFCSDIELELFNINRSCDRVPIVASFNHNFHIRQPQEYKLFCKMNEILRSSNVEVENYGGNIRGVGADIRYSQGGPTGNYKTLSPPECLNFISRLSAIVHFKQTDWGGGVFFHALHTNTPIITTKSYVGASNSSSYLVNNYNCIIVGNEKEAADAVLALINDQQLQKKLSFGMSELKSTIFNHAYWSNWSKFIEACF